MYGVFESHISGRIGDEQLTVQQKDGGKPFCYFSVAVQKPPQADAKGEAKEKEPIWLTLCASGAQAIHLAKWAKAGMWIECWADGVMKKNRRVRDGSETVYNDVTFHIQPGRLRLIGYTTFEKPVGKRTADTTGEGAVPAAVRQPTQAAPSARTNPEDDYEDLSSADESANDGRYVSQLPY